jgi:hypothetical protein
MDVYCYFGTHNLAIAATRAFSGIGNDRHFFFLVPAEYIEGAMLITGATLAAMLIIDSGTIIDVTLIHCFLL